jgi:hypothetical protein
MYWMKNAELQIHYHKAGRKVSPLISRNKSVSDYVVYPFKHSTVTRPANFREVENISGLSTEYLNWRCYISFDPVKLASFEINVATFRRFEGFQTQVFVVYWELTLSNRGPLYFHVQSAKRCFSRYLCDKRKKGRCSGRTWHPIRH